MNEYGVFVNWERSLFIFRGKLGLYFLSLSIGMDLVESEEDFGATTGKANIILEIIVIEIKINHLPLHVYMYG